MVVIYLIISSKAEIGLSNIVKLVSEYKTVYPIELLSYLAIYFNRSFEVPLKPWI
jgi:hypothetical protein